MDSLWEIFWTGGLTNPLDVIEPGDEDFTTTTTTTTTVYDIQYEKVFSTLQEINKDTVGWLTVNNTRIDYPVVQAKDNDYYLRRDYYQNKNSITSSATKEDDENKTESTESN